MTDSDGSIYARPLSIQVFQVAPIITTTSLPYGFTNAPYSQQVAVLGGTGVGVTWTVSEGSLPEGLSLSPVGTPNALISGTPTGAGLFTFWVIVTDSAGFFATQLLSIQVNQVFEPLGITTTALPNGVRNAPYSQQVTASGGTGGFTWTIDSGELPPGLSLSPAGTPSALISGTPTALGTFGFTVKVTDSDGSIYARPLSIQVIQIAPIITTTSLPYGFTNAPYSQQVAVLGGTGVGVTWTVSEGALPEGLLLLPVGTPNALIFGVPTTLGTFNFTIKATDSDGSFATQSLSIQVVEPLVITTTSLPSGVKDEPYSQQVAASGGEESGFTWTLDSGALPPGLSLSPSGTPDRPHFGDSDSLRAFSFTVRVTDSLGSFDTQPLSIEVVEPPTPVTHYTVDTLADDATKAACTTAADDCSLRGAITTAKRRPRR